MRKYGIHGLGVIGSTTLWNRFKPALNGFRFRQGWKGFEDTPDTFDNSYWKDQFDIVIADQKYVSFISIVAPTSSDNTPDYVFSSPYNVPLITTDRGTYPHFINSQWVTRFLNHWTSGIKNLLLSYTDKTYLLCWQLGEASTGDEGTTKGTIQNVKINGVTQSNPSSYDIDDIDWRDHKRNDLWPVAYDLTETDLSFINLMVNTGNDGMNFQWVLDNMPHAWIKIGFPTHNYNQPGEKWRAQMGDIVRSSGANYNRIQSEFEQIITAAWFSASLKRNTKAVWVSALHHGVDILNISLGNLNTIFGTDLTFINWINQYFGVRHASETNKGFCLLRQVIDINDTTKYPEADYGPVINPSQLTTYNNKVANANADPNQSDFEKLDRINKLTITYLNPARITALRAAFPDAAFHDVDANQDMDSYNMDFGVDMIPDNYYRFVTQIDPDGTSKGYWRLGPVNGYDGRFARGFDISNSKDKLYFTTELITTGSNYQAKIEVKYYDSGTGQWSLQYHNGTAQTSAGTVTNANSNTWKTKLFTIADLQAGGLLDRGADWILQAENSHNVQFEMVEFTRVAENAGTNEPPVVLITTSDTTIQQPATSVVVTATVSDSDGTIASTLWTHSGPSGFSIDDDTSPNTTFNFPNDNTSVGVHVFTLTATDDLGATGDDSITIIVNGTDTNLPPVAVIQPVPNITFPVNTVTLDGRYSYDPGGTIASYLWFLAPDSPSQDGIFIENETNSIASATHSLPGTFKVGLTVTDSNGESNTKFVTYTVSSENSIDMAVTITTQPGANAILASMRPIIIKAKTPINTPMVFCDLYIQSIYVGTYEHTIPDTKNPNDWVWQFDVREKVQEYFQSVTLPANNLVIANAGTSCQVFCKLRASTISNGVIVPDGPEPVQAANGNPAVPGGGTPTNIFWVLHSTIQHESNLDLVGHLTAYKSKVWITEALPLTHRGENTPVAFNKRDFFPFVLTLEGAIKKMRLHYRKIGRVTFDTSDYDIPASAQICQATVTSVTVDGNGIPPTATLVLNGTTKYCWSIADYNDGELSALQDNTSPLELPSDLPAGMHSLTIYPYCESLDQQGAPFTVSFVIGTRPTIWQPVDAGTCKTAFASYTIINFDPGTGTHVATRTFDDGGGSSVTFSYDIFCSATNTTQHYTAVFATGQLSKTVGGLGPHCYTVTINQTWSARVPSSNGYVEYSTLGKFYTDVSPYEATGDTKPNISTDPDYVAPVYNPVTCPPAGSGTRYRAITVKTSTDAGTICAASTQTVYINSGYSNIASGITVYTNSSLTTPLTGKSYIVSDGDIYNISSTTGVVQTSTGTTC